MADSEKFKDIIEKIEKFSALELSELVSALEEKFGVSAAMPVAQAAGAGGEGDGEEKSSFNIELKSTGEQKIQVIKALREITGLGLKEAKDMADQAPKMVKEGVEPKEAEEIKTKLENAGAVVELK